MTKKNENLIKDLVSDLKPLKVVKFNFIDFFKIISVALFCIFAAVSILGLRFDFKAQTLNLKYLFDTFLLLLLGTLSTIAALFLSIPSPNNKNIYKWPFLILLLILGSTGYSFLTTSDPFLYLGHGFTCVYEIISLSILPSAILFFLIRKAAALKRDLIGLLVLISGLSFGLLGTQLTCSDETPLHILFWHILPTFIVMLCGIFIARMFIKKI